MSITTLVLIVYLAILLLIAFSSFSKINDHVDFFIARKKGNIFTITGSLVATILGGSAIIGTIDEGPLIGWATSWYMLCASLGLLALIPLTSRVNRSGKFTLPELLGDLFDSKAKLISSVIIPVAWIGIIAAQIIAAARIIQSFTGINYNTGVVISGLVFIFYTIAGGQISVLKTDFFQAILIVTGLVIVAFFAFKSRCNTISSLTNLGLPFNIHFSPGSYNHLFVALYHRPRYFFENFLCKKRIDSQKICIHSCNYINTGCPDHRFYKCLWE